MMTNLKDWVLEAMRQNRFAEAEKTLRGALEAPTQSTDLRFLLGTVLAASGKLDDAIQYLEEVRKLAPNNVSLLNNLGNVLRLKGRPEEAVAHLRHALTIQPDSPDALINLGLSLLALGRADQAVQCGRLALRLRAQDPEALFMLASALAEEGRTDEAMQCFEQVLHQRPGHPAALNGLALAKRAQGKLDDAVVELRNAITAAPEDPTLHTNLGLCLMEQGDLAGGSIEYEWRLRRPGAPRLNAPLWDGRPLAGRTLLLWADTGLADGIQMLRFAPLLRSSAARIVLACPAPLARLAATAPGLDHIVANGEPTPPVHAYLPLTSLLNRLSVTTDSIPSPGAYLAVDPTRAAALKPMLGGAGFKVGLVWNSGSNERRRNLPLAALAPLLAVPGVRFFGLDQAGAGDIAASPFAGRMLDLSPKLNDLADMAAAISQLDLVVTIDGIAAHIAGALGRSAWVMLPTVCEWRWSTERTDSPWYPSLLLFRQAPTEGWERVVEQIAGALAVFGNAGATEMAAPLELPPQAAPRAAGLPFLTALRQYRSVGAVDQLVSALALVPNSPDLLFRLGAIYAEAGRASEAQDYFLRLRRLAFDPAQLVSLSGLAAAGDDLKIALAWSGHDAALNALLDVPGLRFFALTARPADDRITDLSDELGDFYRYAAALRQLDLVITTDIGIAHLASALDRPAWLFLPPDAEAGWLTRIATMPCYTQLRVFQPEEGRGEQSAVHRLVGEVASRVLVGDRDHRAETLNNLGVLLRRFGRLDQAIACYRRALAKRADYPLALGNLGMALQEQGNVEEAITCLVKALELKPGSADGHNNLAVALEAAGIADQAMLHYRHALSLKTDHPQALANLGNIERLGGRLDEAERLERRALEVKPDYPEALAYLGATLRLKGENDAGIECFRRAIATRSDYPAAHMGLAMALMAKGDLRAGSAEYEWRWHGWRGAKLPAFNAPMWDGQVLGDKTLLLWSEQGLGETLQFIRFVPLLRSFASRIILACPPALVRLMTTAPGLDGVVPLGEHLPPFDAHLPLMSAMHRLGTTIATIPSNLPYLAADAARIDALGGAIGGDAIRIGLSWGSDSDSPDGSERSIRLDAMRQILGMRGLSFFSLQRGPAAAELTSSGFADRIIDLTPYLADAADAAAAISLMDLVVAVDGTVAHLAGALDKNTWLLLPHSADWRWFEKRTDTPWYRSTLLFRQPSPGDWGAVVEQAAFALAAGTAAAPALAIA
ncbi:MAG TPA: tetratricopeptide repeat protein [Stellaceae bacterium]|nr:tetratricopeptide repeat protein [Stellaceae bacterium]